MPTADAPEPLLAGEEGASPTYAVSVTMISTVAAADETIGLRQRGLRLEYATLGWNAAELARSRPRCAART